jgi:hypothetical protein
MMAKVSQSSELYVRCRRFDKRESRAACALASRSARSRASTAVVEAHHAALRSPSHSSTKAENWFQLRLVGVTAIREPGFCRASSMEVGAPQSLWELRGGSICAVDEVLRRHNSGGNEGGSGGVGPGGEGGSGAGGIAGSDSAGRDAS